MYVRFCVCLLCYNIIKYSFLSILLALTCKDTPSKFLVYSQLYRPIAAVYIQW